MSITFKQITDRPLKNKVSTISGKDYFLEKLTPNEFEVLIYHLAKHEIKYGEFQNTYEDAFLLGGVRDKGRDVALFFKGACCGVIQCKHSENVLNQFSKSELVREIIKFLLHSFLDSSLLSNSNSFTYYIAISHKFSADSFELLKDFNNLILNEDKLQKWCETVIKSNKAFEKFSYTSIEQKLKEALSKLLVRIIVSDDIKLWLRKDYNNSVVTKFFEVKQVINDQTIIQGIEEIKKTIQEQSEFKTTSDKPISLLLEEVKKASFNLFNQKNQFENVSESHIVRKETSELLNWIKTPLTVQEGETNIALLVGNAGCGKTVILKDLYTELVENDIPVLGLKSDRYYVNSIAELEDKLNLNESITKIIRTLKEEYEHVIILIDQLDALSQTLSGKREYLDTFNYLINEIKNIDKVRIIISVRTYDLNYDPDLQNYRNHKIIKVSLLNPEEVTKILLKLGVTYSSLSSQLKNLLSTPNNLNVFCKVYNSSFILSSIQTLHDLYDKLWEQKTIKNLTYSFNSENVKSFLFELAYKMNSQQRISLHIVGFNDVYHNEINYLASEQIVINEGEQLQFFHQTFYDYVFAKQFIEKEESIEQFILQNNNGLFIRSALKMIITFLSKYEHSKYIETLDSILHSKKFKFHIKFLLINLLGYEENPSIKEKQFLKYKVFKNKKLKTLFIESVNSGEWLKFLIEEDILNNLISNKKGSDDNINLCYLTLSRHLPRYREIVLNYLNVMSEFNSRQRFIIRLLYFLKEWDNSIAFKLFESSLNPHNEGSFDYYKILEDAIEYDHNWVIKVFKSFLINKIEGRERKEATDRNMIDYHENEICEKLYAKDSLTAFNFSYEIVELMINKDKPKGEITTNYMDLQFWLFDYDRAEKSHGYEHFFYMMIKTLEDFAKDNVMEFREIYESIKNTYSYTFQRLLIYGLIQNPTEFKNEIFEFIAEQHKREGFQIVDKVDYQIRQLIKVTYEHFNSTQKNKLIVMILSIRPENEIKVFSHNGKKILPGKFYGKTMLTYLKCIPNDELLKNYELKKTYQELKRKFDNPILDEEPNKIRIRGIIPPLNSKSRQEMSFQNWISTFKKYNNSLRDNPFSNIGGLNEHARSFKEEVIKRTDHFFPLIEQLINEEVPTDYLIEGLNGLKEGNYHPNKTMQVFKKAIKNKFSQFETLQLVWITEYFIKHKIVDDTVLDFLCYNAINHEDPKEDKENPLQHGINTVRGAAVDRIVRINFNVSFSDKIFSTLLNACDDLSLSVRVSMMPSMFVLMHLSRERTLELFLKATLKNEEEIISYSFKTAQYLSHNYFEKLLPYFEKAMIYDSTIENVSILLAIAWLNNKEESYDLLQKALKNNNKAKSKMIDVSINNIIRNNKKLDPKCVELYCSFLNEVDKDIITEYGNSFLFLKPKDFQILLPILKKYAKSRMGTVNLHYFYDYIMKCVKKHPRECLLLLSNFKKQEKPDVQQGYTADERIKVVIGIYNSLRESIPYEIKYLNRALTIFDYMLQDTSYRKDAYRVIQEVEV